MLLVDPFELFFVEFAIGLIYRIGIEVFDQLLCRKDFVVAVRPAQADDVVVQTFGQQTELLAIVFDRWATFALRQTIDARCMAKYRRLLAQRMIKRNLIVRVIDMIGTTNHVRNLQCQIVDDDGKLIRRHPIRTNHDEIVEIGITLRYLALNHIVERRFALERHLKTHDMRPTIGTQILFAARSVITRAIHRRLHRLFFRFELFARARATISFALGNQTLGDFVIYPQSLRLAQNRAIPVQSHPF